MRRSLWLGTVFVCFVAASTQAAVTLIDQSQWRFSTSGFVELDTIGDSTGSLTEVQGNTPVARPGTMTGERGRTQFSPRNSRVAFALNAPSRDGWDSQGYLEFDLLGYTPPPGSGGTESSYYTNPSLRLRHAYLQAQSNGWRLLAGQSWSLFGWQPNYVLTTVSVPPVAGVLYERPLQVTAVRSVDLGDDNVVQAGISVVRPVQRDSQIPGVDLGLRLASAGRRAGWVSTSGDIKAEPMSIGFSGSARDLVQLGSVPGQATHYMGYAGAVDVLIPLIASKDKNDVVNTLVLTGEYSAGQGYGDQFPGWTGNLASVADLDAGQAGLLSGNVFTVVKLQTWNSSLQYHLPRGWNSFVNVGYSRLFSGNMTTSFQATTNTVAYDRAESAYVNFFHDFTANIRAAVECSYTQTRYVDGVYAHNDRYQVSGWFRF